MSLRDEAPFQVSAAGVRRWFVSDEDGLHVASFQDVDAILDRNKAMAAENDGWSPGRTLRRVASIPLTLLMKWRTEEGWDPFDRENADRLARKLNDPDYRWLRTAPGRVAPLPDGGLR